MLGISSNKIKANISPEVFDAVKMIRKTRTGKILVRSIVFLSISVFILMLLPWTQNVRARGTVTTLNPEQRVQTIHSIIAGRIEKWFVREGSYVSKGDTILFISEIKDEYFDPNLLSNTEQQIKAKELSVNSYMEKVKSLDSQVDALLRTKKLKAEQADNYILQAHLQMKSDSIELEAAKTNLIIANRQYERIEQLHKEGLKSLSDLEEKRLKLQEAQAKRINADNKLLSSRNKLINAQVELSSVENQYRDKLAKAESEKYTALSSMYDAEAVVTKMQNQYMNYSVRKGLYYITAPQSGYITKTFVSGIGETVKEGQDLITIVPSEYELAVAMFIRPMDIPLINKGQEVRFLFDGWPAVAFAGWPDLSFGTFGGKVVAIDNVTSENGNYRVIVTPDPDDPKKWPKGLRLGSGAIGMALLDDVTIWYELWRNLNGFPPNFYDPETSKSEYKIDKKEKE